ncbi:MAG: translation elongation factor 4 [Patescibacteria group bacterium]|nr:translation elongation factor 4 [Patescibacteria group bacterium]
MNEIKIRNFCIIAHIDHGKSTLADRFLELTKTVEKRNMKEQLLDTMELERERGITIKLQPVRMKYSKGGEEYTLNLIDTPGHVDFSYEVSRSLAAVEGAILLVDASQGIEAQTLTNIYMALEHNLEIIPVVNKIDLPQAEPVRVAKEIEKILGVKKEEIIFASAKTGEGVKEILDRIIEKVPPPKGNEDGDSRALIFDSFYDQFKGVITYVRVFDGSFSLRQKIEMLGTKKEAEILEIGYLNPALTPLKSLETGQIGFIVTGLREVKDARVGDTITIAGKSAQPLPGYKKVTPFVFAGLFTTSGEDFPLLKDALAKLTLSDSSLTYEPESSTALGFGFRCGFLGLLHLEIVKERLEREFNLDLIVTSPSVTYEIVKTSGETIVIKNPSEFPDMSAVKEIREPWLRIEVVTPKDYLGGIIKILQEKRGIQKAIDYIDETRMVLAYEIPMGEVITDFYDNLKTISSGYASLGYEIIGFKPGDMAKIDILVSGVKVDALSFITFRINAYKEGLKIVSKLKESIPKQLFKVTLQAAIGGKILAREDIPALRKDVTAKLYGGDVTRKRKLLEKQKKGKKKMKAIGNVEIPTEAFLELLRK